MPNNSEGSRDMLIREFGTIDESRFKPATQNTDTVAKNLATLINFATHQCSRAFYRCS